MRVRFPSAMQKQLCHRFFSEAVKDAIAARHSISNEIVHFRQDFLLLFGASRFTVYLTVPRIVGLLYTMYYSLARVDLSVVSRKWKLVTITCNWHRFTIFRHPITLLCVCSKRSYLCINLFELEDSFIFLRYIVNLGKLLVVGLLESFIVTFNVNVQCVV